MRQQTTNTFDKGLNTDLNPIVTPNNVLTDCLNGTFITFNGDELVLQNDAGNTTVNIPDSSELYEESTPYAKGSKVYVVEGEVKHYYKSIKNSNTEPVTNDDYWEEYFPNVTLTKGFHPLGMKEYGGVLYIASGKHGNIGTIRTNGSTIKRGDPDAEEDLIEFGSYPSPMFAKPVARTGLNTLEGYKAEDFYKAITINELDFRSGGYVQFAPANIEVPHDLTEILWTPTNPNGFYIVRLLHQFETGTFDLTELIWKKYTEFLKINKDEPSHWINSNKFKFFCPNRYKGKLAIVIEINEPTHFELAMHPVTTFVDSNFKLDIYINMDRRIEEGDDLLRFLGYKVDLVYNDDTTNSYSHILDAEDDTEGVSASSFFIPNDKKHASYTITPITNYKWENLPVEFRDKFTLRGSIFLEDRYLDLYFVKKEGICMPDKKGTMQYKVLLLGDGTGLLGWQELGEGQYTLEKIDPKNGDKPVAFYLQGHVPLIDWENEYLKKGEFTVGEDGKVTIDTTNSDYIAFKASLDDHSKEILQFFESLTYSVEEENTVCDTQYMTIKFEEIPVNPKFVWNNQPLISAIAIQDSSTVYRVAIIDMNDTLSVTAFGITRTFRNIKQLPGEEYRNTHTFTIPAPKPLFMEIPAPTCTISGISGPSHYSMGTFTFPHGTDTDSTRVDIEMVYYLEVLEGHITPPSNSLLTVTSRAWDVISKSVTTTTETRGQGEQMRCTLKITLGNTYLPPQHNPRDPYPQPGYPTEEPIPEVRMVECSTALTVTSVRNNSSTKSTIRVGISGARSQV